MKNSLIINMTHKLKNMAGKRSVSQITATTK